MNRRHLTIILVAGLTACIVMIFLVWCPPDACRALHIRTYTISSLDEYRQFLLDETAFTSSHNVRSVRLHCEDLRDDVATALAAGRLAFETGKPIDAKSDSAPYGPLQAWHDGRVLHLSTATAVQREELGAWAMRVREGLAARTTKDLSFIPRLFGGVILHVQNRQIPIVLFSEQPCL